MENTGQARNAEPEKSKICRLAIVSFMLSMLVTALFLNEYFGIIDLFFSPIQIDFFSLDYGFFFLALASAAVLLGILAHVAIARSGGKLRGTGLVIAGLLTPIVILGIFPYPNSRTENSRAREGTCLSKLRCLAMGMKMYTQDWDGSLPPPNRWNEAVFPYVKTKDCFVCPEVEDHKSSSYAMNARLSGRKICDIKSPDKTIMLFDSVSGKDLFGGLERLPHTPRHMGGNNLAFTDGHAKWMPVEKMGGLWGSPSGSTRQKE